MSRAQLWVCPWKEEGARGYTGRARTEDARTHNCRAGYRTSKYPSPRNVLKGEGRNVGREEVCYFTPVALKLFYTSCAETIFVLSSFFQPEPAFRKAELEKVEYGLFASGSV